METKLKIKRSTLLKIITIITSLLPSSQSTKVNIRGSNRIPTSAIDDARFITQAPPKNDPSRLKKGVYAGGSNTNTLLDAIKSGDTKTVELLLKNGADPNKADKEGRTVLMVAANYGYEKITQLSLNKGANPNKADNNGFTALYFAAQNGHLDVVKYLVKKGADVNKANNNGFNPLYIAAQNGHLDVVKYLVEKDADVNKAHKDGYTPLYIAAQNGHLNAIKYLVKKGADVNRANNNGFTPLMVAAEKGRLDVIDYLVKKGADVNKANNNGITPLFIAEHNGHLDVVKYLVEKGADVNKANNKKEGKNSGSHIFSSIALAIILPLFVSAYNKMRKNENNLKESKEQAISKIRELLGEISDILTFELDEQKNILSLKLTSDDEKQKKSIYHIINPNNSGKFFNVIRNSISISLNESDAFCPYERVGDEYQIKKNFQDTLHSIKKSIAAKELAYKKSKESAIQKGKLDKTLTEQILEVKSLLQNKLDNIAEKEARLQLMEHKKNHEKASDTKRLLYTLVGDAINYHKILQELDTSYNDEKNKNQIGNLEEKLNTYKVSQVAAVGQDNSGEVAGQAESAASTSQEADPEAPTSQEAEPAASTSQEAVDQTEPTEEIQSRHTPTQPISSPSAITMEQELTLSDLNKFRDLLCGISRVTFTSIEPAQEKPNSANPLTSKEAKEIAETTSCVFNESKQKAAATQDDKKLNQEKENFHALLEQAIHNVQSNSEQLPQQAEYKKIKSLIYAFLCHCAGDKESVTEAFIRIENEGKQTGSYTGLGHASGNTIENLKSLQDLLQHFIESDIEKRIFQAANYNDLMEFLQNYHLLQQDNNPEQPQIKRITFDIPKNPQEYVIDLAKEIIINPEIKAQDAEFASKIKKEIEEFITGNKLLLNHVESNKENGQPLIMTADNDVESFLKEDIKKDFKDLKRIIEISLNNEEQEEVVKSFIATTFNDFMSKLKYIYTQEEHKIKTEHRDREVGQAR